MVVPEIILHPGDLNRAILFTVQDTNGDARNITTLNGVTGRGRFYIFDHRKKTTVLDKVLTSTNLAIGSLTWTVAASEAPARGLYDGQLVLENTSDTYKETYLTYSVVSNYARESSLTDRSFSTNYDVAPVAWVPDVRRELGAYLTADISETKIAEALYNAQAELREKSGFSWLDWGIVTRDYTGTSDGAVSTYRTRFFPVLNQTQDSGGVISDTASHITIESKDISGSTYSSVSNTTYTLQGEKGLITFSTIPAAGKEIYVSYKFNTDFVRSLETSLACYYLAVSMAGGAELAKTYRKKFEIDYRQYIEGRPYSPEELGRLLYQTTQQQARF